MAALTERQTRTLQVRRRTRHGLTWIRALTQSSFTQATSAAISSMRPRHRQAVARRTTAPVPSPLPEHQVDQCWGNWEWEVTDSTPVLTPWVLGQVSAFFKVTTEGRCSVALVTGS